MSDFDRLAGATVNRIRMSRKMTMEKLGEMTGVSYQQIQKYCHGRNRMSLSTFVNISNAMGCRADELLGTIIGKGNFSRTPYEVTAYDNFENQIRVRLEIAETPEQAIEKAKLTEDHTLINVRALDWE